ncbi:MAG: cellulase-like family protein [Bacteroidales bacterium]|nr:cellulase-like family protein [Bacteroidales bacterium]
MIKSNKIDRRNFIKNATAITGAMMIPSILTSNSNTQLFVTNNSPIDLMEMENPVAITMWDYSWLLRHHKYGDFEDWDKVLDGLVERGYNALRIDCFPHMIASDNSGNIQEEFLHIRETYKPALWGNDYTMRSQPRNGLIEFLTKCKERGIYIGLSTWFMSHGTERNLETKSVSDFVRVWDETLTFIQENNLLQNIIYVDLINEYPLWHGLEWFKTEMNHRTNEKLFKENNPDANVPDDVFIKRKGVAYTPLQIEFFQRFIDDSITQLKAKWPNLRFFASFPGAADIYSVNISKFDAIDPHFWFVHHGDFNKKTSLSDLHMFRSEKQLHFEENYMKVLAYWNLNKKELTNWMEFRIKIAADLVKKYNIPVGNTEGWGAVFWQDHPLTGWEFIKEAADVSVELAIKHNYRFICTSNFTHPQFKGMWEDVKWHQQITSRIKAGK